MTELLPICYIISFRFEKLIWKPRVWSCPFVGRDAMDYMKFLSQKPRLVADIIKEF